MNNVIIVKPPNYQPEGKNCLICNLALLSKQDVINHKIHGCCLSCDVNYRYPNKEKWVSGWRPALELNN
tara:strand:- start:1108 stop:1314 length:207 start_codon:yes stop_codon:yes gene_type:complete